MKYNVVVTQEVTESSTFEIEANSKEEAEEMALSSTMISDAIFKIDDVSASKGDRYVSSCEEMTEPRIIVAGDKVFEKAMEHSKKKFGKLFKELAKT